MGRAKTIDLRNCDAKYALLSGFTQSNFTKWRFGRFLL